LFCWKFFWVNKVLAKNAHIGAETFHSEKNKFKEKTEFFTLRFFVGNFSAVDQKAATSCPFPQHF